MNEIKHDQIHFQMQRKEQQEYKMDHLILCEQIDVDALDTMVLDNTRIKEEIRQKNQAVGILFLLYNLNQMI